VSRCELSMRRVIFSFTEKTMSTLQHDGVTCHPARKSLFTQSVQTKNATDAENPEAKNHSSFNAGPLSLEPPHKPSLSTLHRLSAPLLHTFAIQLVRLLVPLLERLGVRHLTVPEAGGRLPSGERFAMAAVAV